MQERQPRKLNQTNAKPQKFVDRLKTGLSVDKNTRGRRIRGGLAGLAATSAVLAPGASPVGAEHNQSHAGAYDVDVDITCGPTLLIDPIYGDRMIPANLWVHGFNTDTAGTPQRVFINGQEKDPVIPGAGGDFTSQDSEGRYIDGVRIPVNSGEANEALVLMDHNAGQPEPLFVRCDEPTVSPTTTTTLGTTTTTIESGTTTTIRQNAGNTTTTVSNEIIGPNRGGNSASTSKDSNSPRGGVTDSTGNAQRMESGQIQSNSGRGGTTKVSEAEVSTTNPDGTTSTTAKDGSAKADFITINTPSLLDAAPSHNPSRGTLIVLGAVGAVGAFISGAKLIEGRGRRRRERQQDDSLKIVA